mmetsp:Transcript_123750/g.344434  ORF Transcript_123750/g.344434 Transcript_123750/m.344434 type:complete len:489 (+) Transcript_123750:160-1626(+)
MTGARAPKNRLRSPPSLIVSQARSSSRCSMLESRGPCAKQTSRHKLLEVRHAGVIEDAAHATDLHLFGPAFTDRAYLRLVVDAAPRVIAFVPEEPDVAALAPVAAPGVLDVVEECAREAVLAVADEHHRVVDHGVFVALVEDAAFVEGPIPCCHGHAHRPMVDERMEQWLVPVLWQPLPSDHAESNAGRTRGRLVHTRLYQVLDREVAQAQLHQAARTCPTLHADAISGLVGILVLPGQAMVQCPMESELHRCAFTATCAAALVGVGHARDELLCREGARCLRAVDLHVHLQHFAACDSPTRAASALIGNLLRCTQPRPIHELLRQWAAPSPLAEEGAGVAGGLQEAGAPARTGGRGGTAAPAAELRELGFRSVREAVDAGGPEPPWARVVRLGLRGAAREDGQALVVFVRARRVLPAMLAHESMEGGVLHSLLIRLESTNCVEEQQWGNKEGLPCRHAPQKIMSAALPGEAVQSQKRPNADGKPNQP